MFVPPALNRSRSEGSLYQPYYQQPQYPQPGSQSMQAAVPNPAGAAPQTPQASQAQQVPSTPPPPSQQQQTPRIAQPEHTGGGGLVDSVRRKIRAAAGIYDPYGPGNNNTGNRYGAAPMNPYMTYPSMMPQQREDPYLQQHHAAMMMNPYSMQQQSYPQMMPQSPYSGVYPQQYYQQCAMPGATGMPTYLNAYNQPAMYAAQQPSPPMMMSPQSMYPYGMMQNSMPSPYDPGYYGAPQTPYPYHQTPGYGAGPYTPPMGYGQMMMPSYDPYYGYKRPYFPDRNYVSSVKDLWQSDYV
ncbi:hypothetical protein DFQ28_005647 [Apophysomyces sp. BC1034]|nr:hypothetical protein DFQ30_005672 [Apophysomyces sp. BC1015]KAG0177630.1 hypothetical protein DFQ29_004619 [Apophysomyces sp. BC1021]KAG0187949.1 hypothetical protein DFQ28_005647 [Apophysomyces sp. BC1034]